ncbi:alpha/beta hydrolase [uncultured Arcanobacterium sp.]|uniref:alpha/beta hydrolase n=1 Tax=uncultured Arcanobacterium sp. TaxID=487520 RepID=UPI00261C4E53|nr:alpha/beta hydrolase [uncultured Arcanobacterium sp.]
MSDGALQWYPDELGDGFSYAHFPIEENAGSTRATLIRYRPEEDPDALPRTATPQRFNLLFLHGWNDYFFHKEFARFIASQGGNFYACDLRRFGRSHQTQELWGYIADLHDYTQEIDFARAYATAQSPVPFILYGHSTGGLTAALWAEKHSQACAGLILNSPWLELQYRWPVRKIAAPLLRILAKRDPYKALPNGPAGYYYRGKTGGNLAAGPFPAESDLQNDPFFTTGWQPNPRYWHIPTFPVRFGWLNAVFSGQAEVENGLDITCPIITFTSAQSSNFTSWNNKILESDAVLSVEQIWKRVPQLGDNVLLRKLPGAIHDVVLSRASVRQLCYQSLATWLADLPLD